MANGIQSLPLLPSKTPLKYGFKNFKAQIE